MEGIVDHYFNLLYEDKNPGLLLTKFYCELFGLPFSPSLISRFSKLVKLYGRDSVFKSVLDISSNEELDHGKIYGLLNYICKKDLNNITTSSFDLRPLVSERRKKIESARKFKSIPNPFEDKETE